MNSVMASFCGNIKILILLNFILAVATSDSDDLGDLDSYKISWKGPLLTNEAFNEENVINISTKGRDRYKCIVPDSNDQLNFDASARNVSSGQDTKSPIQVLEPLLKSNYCSYKFELFWFYELCHGKFLRQYHEEKGKYKVRIAQEYYLGKAEDGHIEAHQQEYEKDTRTGPNRPTILVNGHYKPYVMFNMTSGTKCDLTKRSRVSRIIYVCNEEKKHELYSIKEVSTCEYEAIVLSPLLCEHKDFKADTNTEYEIKCYSLGDAPRKPLKTIDAEEEDDEIKDANKRRGIAYFQGRTLIIDADLLLS